MTFHSSNSSNYETMPLSGIVEIVRNGMQQGCIRPCHLYDAVDELIDRLEKQKELLSKVHDYLGEEIRDNIVDAPRASDLADDVWDAIHLGDDRWQRIHL